MRLLTDYQQLHAQGHFPGMTVLNYADKIESLCKRFECKSLLDYGCGKAGPYLRGLHNQWGVRVTLYDPAVDIYSKWWGGQYDGVICCDVLEHIPEEELDETLDKIFQSAKKFVFFTVCCREAKKTLPNGDNCHVNIKDEVWWTEKLARGGPHVEIEFTP